MSTAVLPLQAIPGPPRGSAGAGPVAGIALAAAAANTVMPSASAAPGGAVSAGATTPVPLAGFAAAVLAAAVGRQAQGTAAPAAPPAATTAGTPTGTSTITDRALSAPTRGGAKTRRTATDKPAPAAGGAPGAGIALAPATTPPAGSAFVPNPASQTRTAPSKPADAPAALSPARSFLDRSDIPVSPASPHATNAPSPSNLPSTNTAMSAATAAPPTPPTAILAAAAVGPPIPAAAPAATPRGTADAARAAGATTAQVAGALTQLPQPGSTGSATTITLHLAPPALGNVAIRITAPGGAAPVVTITASHQEAADALATARPNLEASLLRAGLPADTRVIVHPPNTPPSGGETADRGSRHQGGQPRRPPPPPRSEPGSDFAEALDISA